MGAGFVGPPVLGVGVGSEDETPGSDDDVSMLLFREEVPGIGPAEDGGEGNFTIEVVEPDSGFISVSLPPDLTSALTGDEEFVESTLAFLPERADDPGGFAAACGSEEEDDFFRLGVGGPSNSLR